MNLQETIIQLNELKLRGMSSSFEAMTSLPVQNRPSLEVAISKMVDAEVQDRRDRKTAMYLKISKLRYTALLEDVICGTDRNFTKDDLAAIADCAFIRRHENLLIQGKCGCRKILPCLCPWKTGLHARLQNPLSQYEQLCGESCTQQAGWVVPEDDNQSGKV